MQEVHIISLDADGCLFNSTYINGTDSIPGTVDHKGAGDVLKANEQFIETLCGQKAQYDKTVSFVGSNRQDWSTDFTNSVRANKGSCFPAISNVSNKIGANLDKMLLSDIQNNREFGTNFDFAMRQLCNKNDYDTNNLPRGTDQWAFDERKLTLIYAQIHKAASDNPSANITFDFYDDRQDILSALCEFFQKYPHMMPANVKLQLNHYNGGDITPMPTIQGTGSIDKDFRETVKGMVAMSIDRRVLVMPGQQPSPENLENKIKPVDTREISNKLSQINVDESSADYDAMNELKIQMEREVEQYEKSPNLQKLRSNTTKKFQNNCIEHVNYADNKLCVGSSWKPFVKNLGLLCTVIGAPAAILSFGVRVVTGKYAFFNVKEDHSKEGDLQNTYSSIKNCSG